MIKMIENLVVFILLSLRYLECAKLKSLNMTTPIITTDINRHHGLQYSPNEEKLLKYLFKDYNPHIMPKESLNESFKLYIGMAMSQLINIVCIV